MTQISLFDYDDYKQYLMHVLEARLTTERGPRTRLSTAIGCRPAYLSQVLNGALDFSAEQAQFANRFLNHTPAESRYFINLVLLSRAGTADLKSHFQDEINKQKSERVVLKTRVSSNRILSQTDQARYYSSWYYAAIHVCISLGTLTTKEKIADELSISASTVSEVLEFLVEIGILQQTDGGYQQGETNLFIDSSSPFITKHHTNWRVKAIQSLDEKNKKNFNYSGVITCSKKDVAVIQETLIQTVQKIRSVVKASNDETMFVYTMDLYGLLKSS